MPPLSASRRPSIAGLWLAVLLVGVAACTPSRPVARETVRRPAVPPGVDVRPTETFDASAYPATITVETPAIPDVEHDVPAELLNNSTPPPPPRNTPPMPPPTPETPAVPREPVLRTVTGYRVQIFQAASKDEADRRVAEAIAWWRRTNGGTPEVYTVYRAPYYRVRVGNYATRVEADRAARSIGGAFPGSFVVQDRVTVRQ